MRSIGLISRDTTHLENVYRNFFNVIHNLLLGRGEVMGGGGRGEESPRARTSRGPVFMFFLK